MICRLYTSTDVRNMTGATVRQLNYWCLNGVLGDVHKQECGTGNARVFVKEDVLIVAACAHMANLEDKRWGGIKTYKAIAEGIRRGEDRITVYLSDIAELNINRHEIKIEYTGGFDYNVRYGTSPPSHLSNSYLYGNIDAARV